MTGQGGKGSRGVMDRGFSDNHGCTTDFSATNVAATVVDVSGIRPTQDGVTSWRPSPGICTLCTRDRASPDEWNHAIEFLTDEGQACTRTRQEIILLSDVLGVLCVNACRDHECTALIHEPPKGGRHHQYDA